MQSIRTGLALASIVVAIGCSGDRAVAPSSGHTFEISDLPPALIADYSQAALPGSETAVALNDSGDVVGASATGGVLWHGAAHARTTLPIIPTAVANDGTVAGSIDGHAATWINGRVTILDTATSVARAICRCQSAIVAGSVVVNGVTHAALWIDGIRVDAGVPPHSNHAEFSSIANGIVVGNAIVRQPDPHSSNADSTELLEPFSWSHAGGWVPFRLTHATFGEITSLNWHGVGAGWGAGPNLSGSLAVTFDVAAGTGDGELPNIAFFINVSPTGINDSGQISENAELNLSDTGGEIALVSGLLLPPGVAGDRAAGINSAGIVAGQSNGLPVLWIPNP